MVLQDKNFFDVFQFFFSIFLKSLKTVEFSSKIKWRAKWYLLEKNLREKKCYFASNLYCFALTTIPWLIAFCIYYLHQQQKIFHLFKSLDFCQSINIQSSQFCSYNLIKSKFRTSLISNANKPTESLSHFNQSSVSINLKCESLNIQHKLTIFNMIWHFLTLFNF